MTLRATYPRMSRQLDKPVSFFGSIGDHTVFYAKALAATPFALTHYRREVVLSLIHI